MKKGPVKVLIIDDDADLTTMLTDLISSIETGRENEIRVAGSGAAVEAALEAFVPDIMLTDVMVPETDVAAVVAKVRGLNSSAFVVGMSGYSREDRRVARLGSFYDDFIKKPFDVDDFEEFFAGIVEKIAR